MQVVSAAILGEDIPTVRKLALALAEAAEPEIRRSNERRLELDGQCEETQARIKQLRQKKDLHTKLAYGGIAGVLGFLFLPLFLFALLGLFLISAVAARKELTAQVAQLEKLQTEAANENSRRVVRRIGSVHYPMLVRPLAAGALFLDPTGAVQPVRFSYPDIPGRPQEIREVDALVDPDAPLPSLLAIDQAPAGLEDDRFSPHGEELTLLDAADRIQQLLSSQIELETALPVLPVDHNTVLSLLRTPRKEAPPPDTLLQPAIGPELQESLQAVSALAEQARVARELGDESIDAALTQTTRRLDNRLVRFAEARERSFSQVLLPALEAVSGPYDLPMTRRYCPSCHKLPAWHSARLGFSADDALHVPIEWLSRLPEPASAINLRRQIDDLQRQMDAVRGDEGDAVVRRASFQAAIRRRTTALVAEVRQQVGRDFQPNAPRSRNSVLRLNLFDGQWHCPVCAETFPEEEARLMSILKLEEDLMRPIWEHLWLEKQDERNRITGSLEAERRRNLQAEMDEYRREARQYSEEIRPLRIKLDDAGAGAQTATARISTLVEQYRSLGLLNDSDARRYTEFVEQSGTTPDVIRELKSRMPADESQLESEAQRVETLRSTAITLEDEYVLQWMHDAGRATGEPR